MSIVNGYDVQMLPQTTQHKVVTFVIKSKTGYSFNVYLCNYPTMNCQVTSVGTMNSLLTGVTLDAQYKDNVRAILIECYKLMSHTPSLMIMDVKQVLIPKIEECFKLYTKSLYTSTNGSQMCLFLVSF